MSDLISRKAVFDALIEKGQNSKRYKLGDKWELNLQEIIEAINAIPSAEPERTTGKWIKEKENVVLCHCSECGYKVASALSNLFYNYCPNCGADMRGER